MLLNRIGILLFSAILVAGCAGGTDHSIQHDTSIGIVWAGQVNNAEPRSLYRVSQDQISTPIIDDSDALIRSYALSTAGTIAYKSVAPGGEGIVIANSQGVTQNEVHFSADPSALGAMTFSPTGDALAEISTSSGSSDLYVMPTTGSMTRTQLTFFGNLDVDSTICWSTDGFIYFTQGPESYVWRIASTGGNVEFVSGRECKMLNISPNNTQLSMVSLDRQQLVVRQRITGEESVILTLDLTGFITGAAWSDDHTLVYVRQDNSNNYHLGTIDTITFAASEVNPSFFFGTVATAGNSGLNNVD